MAVPDRDPTPPLRQAPEALFHEGERAVQHRAGVTDIAIQVGRGALQPAMDRETAVGLTRAAPWTTVLSAKQAAFVHATDTVFVASAHAERGTDASHRGGRPGFLEVSDDGRRILLPDYTGNRMFQTLGNLTLDPRIGMLVADWETGRTLQLAGTAEILWDGPAVARRRRVDRVVAITVQAVAEQVRALPVRFTLREPHPLNPPLPRGGHSAR